MYVCVCVCVCVCVQLPYCADVAEKPKWVQTKDGSHAVKWPCITYKPQARDTDSDEVKAMVEAQQMEKVTKMWAVVRVYTHDTCMEALRPAQWH